MKYKVGFIGSGNVAHHLAHALDKAGHQIHQVISRHIQHAEQLAEPFGAFASDNLLELDTKLDLVLICVSDDQIEAVAQHLTHSNLTIAHTCGAKHINTLSPASPNYGVFYPLQSFSKDRDVNMLQVPFLLEASNNNTQHILEVVAESISNSIRLVNSADRLKYHMSAVLVNNFVNHLYDQAAQYLESENLDFDVLRPIILETAQKVQGISPREAQTGPAKRGDQGTLDLHRSQLQTNPELSRIYEDLSKAIFDRFNK